MRGVVAHVLQQLAKGALGDQADILGEHGEQATREKRGDGLGRVAGDFFVPLQGLGQLGEFGGDGAGDARRAPRRVQRHRVEPDGAQAFADLGAAQVIEIDAMA